MLEATFWQDKNKAQKVIKEKKFQEDLINSYDYSIKQCTEISELFDLAVEENNTTVINDSLKSIEDLKVKAKKMRRNVFSQTSQMVLTPI